MNDLVISHLLQNWLFGLIGSMIGAKWLVFLLFFFIFSVSYYGFKRLLDFLTISSYLNYIPAFLYAFSPFLFNDIIGGSWVMWLSFSLAPSYFRFLVSYYRWSRVRDLICFILISISVVVSMQNFVMVNTLVLLYLFFEVVQGQQKFRSLIKKTFFLILLLGFINAYWILPFSSTFINFSRSVIFVNNGAGEFASIVNSQQNIWNILSLTGYLDRNMYLYSVPAQSYRVLLYGTTVVFWSAILIYFIRDNNKKRMREGLFWLLSLLLIIVIVKGGNSPFGGLTLEFYNRIPLMKIFRSPQHLMLIPTFILPILGALSLQYFYAKHKRTTISISVAILIVWLSGWWYSGDLGMASLAKQGRDHIDFYQLPPELTRYYEQTQSDKLNYRSLFLPPAFSPSFLETKYQKNSQGAQPEYAYLTKPTFVSEANPLARLLEDSICDKDNFNYLNYLSLFSVRNIVVRTDIRSNFTKGINCKDGENIEDILDVNPNLVKFAIGEYLSAYQIKDAFFLPFVYIPNNIIATNESVQKLGELVSDADYQIGTAFFFTKQNSGFTTEDLGVAKNDKLVLEYTKIDPTKYRVQIRNVKGKFPLILSQNFNSGWKLYMTNNKPLDNSISVRSSSGTVQNDDLPRGSLYETWSIKPLDEKNHFMVNGYANGWLIDPETACDNKINCDFEIIIELRSQKMFYIGLVVSVATSILLLIYWLITVIRK